MSPVGLHTELETRGVLGPRGPRALGEALFLEGGGLRLHLLSLALGQGWLLGTEGRTQKGKRGLLSVRELTRHPPPPIFLTFKKHQATSLSLSALVNVPRRGRTPSPGLLWSAASQPRKDAGP